MSENRIGDTTTPEPEAQKINVATYQPKEVRFSIRCLKCRWCVVNGGTTPELKDLYEIPNNCPTCGKARQFRCPKCGRPAKMTRVKG